MESFLAWRKTFEEEIALLSSVRVLEDQNVIKLTGPLSLLIKKSTFIVVVHLCRASDV